MEWQKKRLDLNKTRNTISLINSGEINDQLFLTIPYFNIKIPNSLLKVNEGFYDPRLSFNKKEDWNINALNLTKKFNENFKKLKFVKSDLIEKYSFYGPKS
tara:strand:- start:237 stop:539 length:303 start_codon:yes stop_codon:yes gene_type:complete